MLGGAAGGTKAPIRRDDSRRGGMSDELLNLSNELVADKELLEVEAYSLCATAEPTDEGETDGDDEVAEGHLLLPE